MGWIYTHTDIYASMTVELLGPRAICNYSGYFLIVFQSNNTNFHFYEKFHYNFFLIVCAFKTV